MTSAINGKLDEFSTANCVSFFKTKRSRLLFAIAVFAQVYCLFVCHSRFPSLRWWFNCGKMKQRCGFIMCVRVSHSCECGMTQQENRFHSNIGFSVTYIFSRRIFLPLDRVRFFKLICDLSLRKSRQFSHSPVNTHVFTFISIFRSKIPC